MANIIIKTNNKNSSLFLLYTITQSGGLTVNDTIYYGIKTTLFNSDGCICDCCAVETISADKSAVTLLAHSLCKNKVLPCTFRTLFHDYQSNVSIHTLLYCIC